MLAEPIAVTVLVTDALDALGVTYAIGGSLASAVHGVVRATMDADLVADLRMEHVEPLAQALGDAFYADVEIKGAKDANAKGANTDARSPHVLLETRRRFHLC